MAKPREKLSSRLPALIFGSATLNYQFNPDPYALHPIELVHRALDHGVRAFDTSPYYGPAESILGDCLSTTHVHNNYPRDQYYLLTKCGRISSNSFDYSPEWIRQSVKRSCNRLRTTYLDVVYCHDVEFVSPAEVLGAVKELRRIRDEVGLLKYVGICGYPVHQLCDLADMILRETGEALDIVQSYSNFTLQNTRLLSEGLSRMAAAGVDVVTNASPLSMGLLRRDGPPVGAMGDWHPAPNELRDSCAAASRWLSGKGEKLEKVAFRFAVENWLYDAAAVGTFGSPLGGKPSREPAKRLGVSVMGVSNLEELEETMKVWRSILDQVQDRRRAEVSWDGRTPSSSMSDRAWSIDRRDKIRTLASEITLMLGPWTDFMWNSPDPGFVNQPHKEGGNVVEAHRQSSAAMEGINRILTPPPSEPDNA